MSAFKDALIKEGMGLLNRIGTYTLSEVGGAILDWAGNVEKDTHVASYPGDEYDHLRYCDEPDELDEDNNEDINEK